MDKMARKALASSSLPSLPSSVLSHFLTLCGDNKKLFKSLYNRLWTHLWPIQEVEAISFGYAVNIVIYSFDLVPGDFWLLSRLMVLSAGGVRAVNSDDHIFSHYENNVITRLMKRGYITRSSFDPAKPANVQKAKIQKTFMSLTPSGIFLHKSVVRKVNKYVQNDILGSFK